ncbi:MAG TPA: hypothetical protein VFR84_02155 [Candidatus Angelobacter sp.]|nr:hypothetical protein [Candidatus Angelobacter sp.]
MQLKLPGQLGDKLLVRIGFRAANLMVKVSDGEHNPECFPHIEQGPEQRD